MALLDDLLVGQQVDTTFGVDGREIRLSCRDLDWLQWEKSRKACLAKFNTKKACSGHRHLA